MEGGDKPLLVSVVPTYNEERWIGRCLTSLLAQSYPANRHIIHIVDGGSQDGTLGVVEECIRSDGPEVVIINNPGRYVPHARNLSLAAISEEVELVFEVNAHGWVPEDHLERRVEDLLCIEKELQGKVGGVGCKVVAADDDGQTMMGSWIESTLSSPLGSGGGQFSRFSGSHPHKVPAFVLHRRQALDDVGGWDEAFITNQDSDLSMRLLKRGWPLWRSDVSHFHMVKRRRFGEFVRMCRRYGFWRTKGLRKHGSRFNIKEFLPILGLILTLTMLFSGHPLWYAPLIVYIGALLISGLFEALRMRRLGPALGVLLLLPVLHTMFSIGLIEGLLRSELKLKDR